MSDQKKLPALYSAIDIRIEAYELERISRLRQMTKKIEWLKMKRFFIAALVSGVMITVIYFILGYLHLLPSTNQGSFLLSFFGTALLLVLNDLFAVFLYKDRIMEKKIEICNLLASDHAYRDTLESLKQRDPELAKRIYRMKFVTGEPA